MKKIINPLPAYALQLDAQDKLASFREAFLIDDPNLVYLDGNSLGRLPKAAIASAKQIVEEEWGVTLFAAGIKAGGKPSRVGDKIGKIIGAGGRTNPRWRYGFTQPFQTRHGRANASTEQKAVSSPTPSTFLRPVHPSRHQN